MPKNKSAIWILKNIDPSICAFLGFKWYTIVAFVILLKHFFKTSLSSYRQKCIFGQSVCRVCISWLVILISSQCYFKIESTQLIFYANSLVELYMNMIFFKELFSEYFSLSSLAVLILSWCFNEVTRVLDGQLYRFTGIADTGIEDNVVINESIKK